MKVTWAYHFTGSSPDWTVDPEWLQRVSDVIDMATSIGLYTIVNVHHGEPLQAEKPFEDPSAYIIQTLGSGQILPLRVPTLQ